MFSNELTIRRVSFNTTFEYSIMFINKNNDEYYGLYVIICYNGNDNCTYIHITPNKIKFIQVNERQKIRNFFEYDAEQMENIFDVDNVYITINFNTFNILDENLELLYSSDCIDLSEPKLYLSIDDNNDKTLIYNSGEKVKIRNDDKYILFIERYNSNRNDVECCTFEYFKNIYYNTKKLYVINDIDVKFYINKPTPYNRSFLHVLF